MNPIEGLQNTIRLFNYYHDLFQRKLPTNAPIGLVNLNCESVRAKIQSTPKDYLAQLEKDIPDVIKKRNEEAKKWLEVQIRNLNKPNLQDVEEFVDQQAFYNYASENFQSVRDKVDMYGQVYNVLAEFQLKVKKEDKDSFGESLTAISKLSGHIQEVETKQEEYKETFKKDVAERVPKLDTEIN
jgi:superfamily II RNA helicase